MAVGKIFRPRRGKKSTMVTKDTVLAKGEFFVEVPENGVGKGIGKLKMGDGVTPYSSLPYLINPMDSEFEFGSYSSLAKSYNCIELFRVLTEGNEITTDGVNLGPTVRLKNTAILAVLSRLCSNGLIDTLIDRNDGLCYLSGTWYNLWNGASITPSVTIPADSTLKNKIINSKHQEAPMIFMVSGYSTSPLSAGGVTWSDLKTFIIPMSLEIGYRKGYTGVSQMGYFAAPSTNMAQTIGAFLTKNSSGDISFTIDTSPQDLGYNYDFYITNIKVLLQ